MAGVHDIKVVIPENVQKGKQGTVDPSSSLSHEILVTLHGIRICNCVRHVFKQILAVHLTVDTKTQDTILS